MGAAASLDRNLAQAFGAFLGAGLCRLVLAGNQRIHGQHDGKVDRRSDDDKGYDRVDEIADKKLAAIDGEANRRKVRLLDYSGNERSEQALHQSGYHGAEGGADHHADSEIHYVAPQQKLFESLHGWLPSL